MQRRIINFTWSDSQTGYGASNSLLGCANCFVQVFNPSARPHVGNSHSASTGWSGSCMVVSRNCKGLIPQNQQKPWEAANSCKQEPGFYGAKWSRKHWSTREPNPFCESLFYYTSEALKPAINKLIAHFSLSLCSQEKQQQPQTELNGWNRKHLLKVNAPCIFRFHKNFLIHMDLKKNIYIYRIKAELQLLYVQYIPPFSLSL